MKTRIKAPIAVITAVASGIVFLFTYFMELDELRSYILSWVTILAAAALILGLVNLTQVHYQRILKKKNTINSTALLVALVTTFTITLMVGTGNSTASWLFNNVIIPVETSLFALLSITLTYATIRLLSRRMNVYTGIFIFFFILTLISYAPIFGRNIPFLQYQLGPWVTTILAGSGTKGILIGVALGTIASGLRVILGADQPYTD